jgi:hypothetical protein
MYPTATGMVTVMVVMVDMVLGIEVMALGIDEILHHQTDMLHIGEIAMPDRKYLPGLC